MYEREWVGESVYECVSVREREYPCAYVRACVCVCVCQHMVVTARASRLVGGAVTLRPKRSALSLTGTLSTSVPSFVTRM